MKNARISSGRRQHRSRGSLVAAATLLVVAASSVACGSSTASSGSGLSKGPFRIAVPADETGTDSAYGLQLLAGIKAAVSYVNAHGGIDGRRVELTVQDTKTDPATAVSEAENMLAGQHYQAMFPATGAINGLEAALAKVATAQGVLEVNAGGDPSVTDPKIFPTAFSMSSGPSATGIALACLLKQNFSATTVGIIHHDEPYSNGEFAAMASSGIKIVANETVTETDQDFTATIQTIQSSRPDVLVVDIFGPQLGQIFHNLRAVGYSGPVVGGLEVSAQKPTQVVSTLSLVPKSMPAVAGAGDVRVNGSLSPLQQSLVSALGTSVTGLLGNPAAGWDGIQLIKYAYEHGPSMKTADLVKTLEGLNGSKAIGTLSVEKPSFSSANHGLQSGDFYAVDYAQQLVSGTYTSAKKLPTSC